MNVKMTHPATVLTILFIVLKIVGVIDWSWWLVTLPFWGCLGLAMLATGLLWLITKWEDRR